MSRNRTYKLLPVIIALSIMMLGLTACTDKEKTRKINTMSSTQEEMENYFKSKGYIAEDVVPVDINQTTKYLTDNTGGEFKETVVADAAYDYNGLWIFWWNQEEQAQNGAFAIAFADEFKDKNAVLADFKALSQE